MFVSSLCVCVCVCVGPQRGLSCVEGDLAVKLNIESVVLLLVCVTMMTMMMTIIMSSPVQESI